jgi:hypothetical protein
MITLAIMLALQTAPVAGEVTSVTPDGKRARVNLGRDSGLKVQDGLRLFSAPELVSLPGTGKAAFAVEREVGTAVVVEVLEKELVAQVVGSTEPIAKGNRAVPGKPVRRGPFPPHIRENVTLDPPVASWGREVTIAVDVEDLDGDLSRLECRVDRGLLLDPISVVPRVRWLPPAEAGEARLTVRAVDRAGGSDERTFTLRADGLPAAAKPLAFAGESVLESPFARLADLGADADGNLYLLDADLRRILKWGPAGRRVWISDDYGHDVEFTRMAVVGGDAFLLDRLGRKVLRYPLGPGMFAGGPRRVYGGKRRGPAALREPMDVAVLPEGDVWVLDASEGTIKTYAEDGSYQTQVGSFEEPLRMRRGAGAAVHVLDGRRRQITTFESGRITRQTTLPPGELPVDFLDPTELLYPRRWASVPVVDAEVIRRDALGRTYVIESEGSPLVRVTPGDDRPARRGGAALRGARRVRALTDGGFAVEDGSSRRVYDAEGWLRGQSRPDDPERTEKDAAGNAFTLRNGLRCGDVAVPLGEHRADDFDVDPFGRVLLLDGYAGRVLRLSVTQRGE